MRRTPTQHSAHYRGAYDFGLLITEVGLREDIKQINWSHEGPAV